jgi:hypothetical protein
MSLIPFYLVVVCGLALVISFFVIAVQTAIELSGMKKSAKAIGSGR